MVFGIILSSPFFVLAGKPTTPIISPRLVRVLSSWYSSNDEYSLKIHEVIDNRISLTYNELMVFYTLFYTSDVADLAPYVQYPAFVSNFDQSNGNVT